MLANQDIRSFQFEFIAAANDALREIAYFDLDDLPIHIQWSIHKETIGIIHHVTKQNVNNNSFETYDVVMMMVIADGIDDLGQFEDFAKSIIQFANDHQSSIHNEVLALVNGFSFQFKKASSIPANMAVSNQLIH